MIKEPKIKDEYSVIDEIIASKEPNNWETQLEYALPGKLTEQEKQVIRNNVSLLLVQKETEAYELGFSQGAEKYTREIMEACKEKEKSVREEILEEIKKDWDKDAEPMESSATDPYILKIIEIIKGK